jgi:tellurite methyltransferase
MRADSINERPGCREQMAQKRGLTLMTYDEAYRRTKHYFGVGAASILKKHCHLLSKARPILDIGVGQGRNALFLARKGYAVEAMDTSEVAVDTVAAIAAKERLPIHTSHCSFDGFRPGVDYYSGVLLFGIIQDLSRDSINLLTEKIRTWTKKGSLVFVSAFTTADPSYVERSRKWREIGMNSFSDEGGKIATYLEPGEVVRLFSGFKVIHHWEGLGPEHSHGDEPPEQHGSVEAVFQR